MAARDQSSNGITWNGYDAQDLLAISRDYLLLDINQCYTLRETIPACSGLFVGILSSFLEVCRLPLHIVIH